MTFAIRFDNVSKNFRLHPSRPRSFLEFVSSRRVRGEAEDFWALKNVSFEIQPGETVGLIGPNGTGKSTLLKLINRIIEPTSGTVSAHGRVAGLLELGSGFHPDLTGRDNIFLNASILGIPRRVVQRQMDDILNFADIGSFIDVPVRNYSLGMAMRLGFAITTTLDPEILLIDEILAVGDQMFQQKCLRRIGDLKREGVTVLLVSHDLWSIANLCERTIWLQDGRIRADGGSAEIVDRYLAFANQSSYQRELADHGSADGQSRQIATHNRWGTFQAEITTVRFLDSNGDPCHEFETGQPFMVEIGYRTHERIEKPSFGVAIYRDDGTHVGGTNTALEHFAIEAIEGDGVVYYHLDQLPLLGGRYQFTAAIYNHGSTQAFDHHHRLYMFAVRQGPSTRRMEGLVRLPSQWRHDTGPSRRRESGEGIS